MDNWPPSVGIRTACALAAAVVIVAAHATGAEQGSNADLAAIQVMHDVSLVDASKPLAELEDKYRKALEKRKTSAQDAGNLDGVLAFKAELDALDTGNQIVSPRNSGDLAKLRRIYQEHKVKLTPEVEAAVAKADKEYADQLTKLVTDLTKSGQTEEAVEVRVALDDFKEAQRSKSRKAAMELAGSRPGSREAALNRLLTGSKWSWRAGTIKTKPYAVIQLKEGGGVTGIYWLTKWEIIGPDSFKVYLMKDPNKYWIFEMDSEAKVAVSVFRDGSIKDQKTMTVAE